MYKNIKTTKPVNPILGINERNISLIYPHNSRKHYPLADDKVLCKEVLHTHGIACAKTYGVINRIADISRIWDQVQVYDKLAIKPSKGSGGGGIIILKKVNNTWTSNGTMCSDEQIRIHMAQIIMGMFSFGSSDKVLIEECIEPHPFFSEIYPAGVPDFRVILLKDKAVMSMLRVPTKKSGGKANLHQGGLGIGIDMKKGVLKMAFDGKHYHRSHPDNQNKILGKKIPFWNDLLSLSIETSMVFPLDYLGVDIVLDAIQGPMIMEINVRPGLGIQLANKEGMKGYINN
ncbi:MAG: alpha-L-glutamate ligase-like protein [Saprospiraceae bacterium]|nr:alpha-L-glutamate ligase-like protein [Saprospiraceae bacterium]